MGVMDDFLRKLKLNESEDDEYENEYADDDDMISGDNDNSELNDFDDVPEPSRIPKKPITKIGRSNFNNSTRKTVSNSDMKVCVIKPNNMEDSREITDTLLLNRTVVLNLEGLDMEIAQRIIDFAAGSCYAIQGNLQKISQYIIIITPPSVDLFGEFPALLQDAYDVPLNDGL